MSSKINKFKEDEDNYLYFIESTYFPGDNQPNLLFTKMPVVKEVYEKVKEQLENKEKLILIEYTGEDGNQTTEIINLGGARNLYSLRTIRIPKPTNIILPSQKFDGNKGRFKGLKDN